MTQSSSGSKDNNTGSTNDCIEVRQEVVTLHGWPTEILFVDHKHNANSNSNSSNNNNIPSPHTLIVFIPGNPGCSGWYIPVLSEIIRQLGPGFAARGTSHAGHSANEELVNNNNSNNNSRDCSIVWTVDGQIEHKCAFLDYILSIGNNNQNDSSIQQQQSSSSSSPSLSTNNGPKNIIFLSHSIGAHMVERLLMLRHDDLLITKKVLGVIHMMPFTRMKSFPNRQRFLNFAAANPNVAIGISSTIMKILRQLPKTTVHHLVDALQVYDEPNGKEITIQILRQPTFAKNFFNLGSEELRDVPEFADTSALRVIGKHCPIKMLYCGCDQWGPEFHVDDLKELQSRNVIPSNQQQQQQQKNNISISYMSDLRHDFVANDWMVPKTIDWCLESIKDILFFRGNNNIDTGSSNSSSSAAATTTTLPRSRL